MRFQPDSQRRVLSADGWNETAQRGALLPCNLARKVARMDLQQLVESA